MRQPKFDIGNKVTNIENLHNRSGWRYENAPKGTLLTIEEIIISNKGVSYKARSSGYSTFTVKEEDLISEKDFIKGLKEKFKK